jgi:hypothetical protein
MKWIETAEGVMESLKDMEGALQYQEYLDDLKEKKETAQEFLKKPAETYYQYWHAPSSTIRQMLKGLSTASDDYQTSIDEKVEAIRKGLRECND